MLRIDSKIIGALVSRSDAAGAPPDPGRSEPRRDPGDPRPDPAAVTGTTPSDADGSPDPTVAPPADARAATADGTDRPERGRTSGPTSSPTSGPTPEPAPWPRWLDSPPGRYVLDWEQTQLDAAVADVFGYHALQCGEPALDALRANRMPHRFRALLPSDALPPDRPAVRVEHFEELPFENQSLDLVVLPHVLEFAHDPHQVLREVDRVLRPEGRLIVTGFNPVSLWGARQLVLRGPIPPFLPREGHFLGVPRLRDWCKLLSFDMERARFGCWRPPCRTQLWLDRTRFMERAGDRWWPICGAVYLLSAVKRVHAMRLIGKAWRRAPAKGAIALPTTQRSPLPRWRSPG
jgi:SAM-dependent methyltransferase